MIYLTIFNTTVILFFISYLTYKYFPFWIDVNKTFWCKKTYSITLMMYTRRSEYGSSSKGLITIPIRNYKKTEEWDDKMFRSGEYKKYQKN